MNTYKIGNKITCIIRAYNSGKIGSIEMEYDNQPYTIIKTATAELVFADSDKQASVDGFKKLYYNRSKLKEVTISDVKLNDKICNLIFNNSDKQLVTKIENYNSSDTNEIYLNTNIATVYQVFVYDMHGELDKAIGEYNTKFPIIVRRPNENYLICYQYEVDNCYNLDSPTNCYYTLDLLVSGNKDDNAARVNIHIDKCGLRVDKDMHFDQESNAVDLIFTVIDNKSNYITFE